MVEITLRYRGSKGRTTPALVAVRGFATSSPTGDELVAKCLDSGRPLERILGFGALRPAVGRVNARLGRRWHCRSASRTYDAKRRVVAETFTLRLK